MVLGLQFRVLSAVKVAAVGMEGLWWGAAEGGGWH